MTARRRHDASGRSTGKLVAKDQKLNAPPEGNWVWYSREFMESDAWRARSINCARFIEFLECEHMAHAGTENGKLYAPFDQLVEKWGIRRAAIREAIDEAIALGLVRESRTGGRKGYLYAASKYRLTYRATIHNQAPPTNEWKGITTEHIEAWRMMRRRQKAERKIKNPSSTNGTDTSSAFVTGKPNLRVVGQE